MATTGDHSLAGSMGPMAPSTPQAKAMDTEGSSHDAMETYFSCISTCSLDDGSCITQCVEDFRQHH